MTLPSSITDLNIQCNPFPLCLPRDLLSGEDLEERVSAALVGS